MKMLNLKVSEFADVYSGGTPSTGNPDYWDGDVAWVTPKDLSVHAGVYIGHGDRCITQQGLSQSSACLLAADIVILFYALKNHFFKDDLIGGGTIFSAVAKKDLHRVELTRPEGEIVIFFTEFVAPIDRQIASLQRAVGKLRQARDTILPRLMNGEIECL